MRVDRILDWVFAGVVASGLATMMIWLAFVAYHVNFDPFPTFGGDDRLDQINRWMLFAIGGLWLAWVISFGRRSLRRPDGPNPTPAFFLALVGAAVGAAGWYVSIPMLNAVLDFGPKIATPIRVQSKSTASWNTLHGTKLTGREAVVNRLDHPDEQVEVDWPKCNRVGGIPSRFVTIKLGRGAFGAPWFSRAINCHRMTIDESPLFDDFRLGTGHPAVLVALVSVGGHSEEDAAELAERAAQLGQWTRAIEGRSPDLRIALLANVWAVAPEHRAVCPHCRAAVKGQNLDSDILDLLFDTDPWLEGDRVYLVDGKGRMIFEAPLSDTDQTSRLLDKLGPAVGAGAANEPSRSKESPAGNPPIEAAPTTCRAWAAATAREAGTRGEQAWRDFTIKALAQSCSAIPEQLRRAAVQIQEVKDPRKRARTLATAASAAIGGGCFVAEPLADARKVASTCPLPPNFPSHFPYPLGKTELMDIRAVDYVVLDAMLTGLTAANQVDESVEGMILKWTLAAQINGEEFLVREDRGDHRSR